MQSNSEQTSKILNKELIDAVRGDEPSKVAALMKKGADPLMLHRSVKGGSENALQVAVSRNKEDMLRAILESKTSATTHLPSYLKEHEDDLLDRALNAKSPACLSLLLEHGVDVKKNSPTLCSILETKIPYGSMAMGKILIQHILVKDPNATKADYFYISEAAQRMECSIGNEVTYNAHDSRLDLFLFWDSFQAQEQAKATASTAGSRVEQPERSSSSHQTRRFFPATVTIPEGDESIEQQTRQYNRTVFDA